MKKLLTAGVAAMALISASASAETRIGMITTLSGGGSHLGIDVRDGFELALKQSGRSDVELIVRDDANKPDVAKSLSDELIQSEKVDILTGIIFSNLAMAVVPGAVRDVFYISPNAGPSALAGKLCNPNYFNVAWQNDNLHEAMGGYMKQAGLQKPFILAPNYPAGTDALNGFKRFYGEEGLAGEIYTQLGQTDYAAEIAQIRASGADSVFFFLPGGMGIAFMKQYAAANVGIPVFGPAFSFDEIIVQALGDAAIGVKNTSQWAYDLDNDANNAFVESFRAEFGRTPTLYASQGFDTANLILSALEKAAPGDKDAFRAALEAAEFTSVRGDFKFGPNHHPIQDIYVREVVTGPEGKPTNKLVGIALEDHADAYAAECKM